MNLVYFVVFLQTCSNVIGTIRTDTLGNRIARVKPVGRHISKKFLGLSDMKPTKKTPVYHEPHGPNGRRHLPEDCTVRPKEEVFDGGKVDIFGDYYDDRVFKTVATVIIPDHIDHMHFEVTTQVPYLTLGPVDGIGFHPSTIKSEHPSECEEIYQDHKNDQYSEESPDESEESLEMARMPLFPGAVPTDVEEEQMYSDVEALKK